MWIQKGIVDYVVLMNYTIDEPLFEQNVNCALGLRGVGGVQIGIGAFLLKASPSEIAKQYRFSRAAGAAGVVFFAYDDVTAEFLKGLD